MTVLSTPDGTFLPRSFSTGRHFRDQGSASRGLIVAVALVLIAVVVGANYLRDRRDAGSVLGGLEPMPAPTRADFRTQGTAEGTKYWPRSAPLIEGVQYRYNTGHCGLEWMTDFDGSFWTPHHEEGTRKPRFFYSEDDGTLTVLSHDRASYRSAGGGSALLTRHDGPLLEEGGCG